MALFVIPAVMLFREGVREGTVPRDKVMAMLTIFVFNVLFWMFFEQAGSSFNFLADKIVDRDIGMVGMFNALAGTNDFPVSWFQSVNSVAIIVLAPILAWLWVRMGKNNPTIPRKFGLGLIFNGLAFLLLMVRAHEHGRRCRQDSVLDPVHGLRDPVGRRALPVADRLVDDHQAGTVPSLTGFAMGCWFLSIAIGNNLAGIFAGQVSGEGGMTVESAHAGYTFGFYALVGAGVLLFLIAPLIQKWMHGVK